jgi:hypothetical protein
MLPFDWTMMTLRHVTYTITQTNTQSFARKHGGEGDYTDMNAANSLGVIASPGFQPDGALIARNASTRATPDGALATAITADWVVAGVVAAAVVVLDELALVVGVDDSEVFVDDKVFVGLTSAVLVSVVAVTAAAAAAAA